MKKLMLLSLVVAFALLGTQALASPPIKPPVEGFIISSDTTVIVDPLNNKSSFTESEKFNWTYYEGWGKGPFYPNGYTPVGAGCIGTTGSCAECGATNCQGLVSELGFTEGAEIAYEQVFDAKDGHIEFTKAFDAKSNPLAGDDNLVVSKKIDFTDALAGGYAKHTEKVGLSVISMGSADVAASPASSLLSLCPWAASSTSSTGIASKGYPPTNEGIAAASTFNVTKLVGFETSTKVNSSINPKLTYDVIAPQGEGTISAGFVVDLWEGPEGYVWAPVPLVKGVDVDKNGKIDPATELFPNSCCSATGCICDQAAWISQGKTYADWIAGGQKAGTGLQVWQLPQYAYGEPPLASKTHYEEHASATGSWNFTKKVSYESTMPGVTGTGQFPFNQVP